MAYISFQPNDYFSTKLYTGTGSSQSITGVGFQPDWLWQKSRSNSQDGRIFDAVRGGSKVIYPSLANTESTDAQLITSFDSDGFTMGSAGGNVNDSGTTNVAWNWKANGVGSANTDGSINTTYTSANTTSGFSIVKYTGTGSNATVGHGLGAVPKMIIVKCLDQTHWWFTYHVSVGNTKHITLNTVNGESGASANYWNNTTPTSSVFSIGTDTGVNQSGQDYIAYCFAEKKGFSKVGSYIGNQSANAPFIYTGFKPAWLLIKNISDNDDGWLLIDNKRSAYNQTYNYLTAQSSAAEGGTGFPIDLVSNGFKIRGADISYNQSGYTYIFMAFAEEPLVSSNGVPAVAR